MRIRRKRRKRKRESKVAMYHPVLGWGRAEKSVITLPVDSETVKLKQFVDKVGSWVWVHCFSTHDIATVCALHR